MRGLSAVRSFATLIALGAGMPVARAAEPAPAPAAVARIDALAQRLHALVIDESPESALALEAVVRRGPPPAAIAVMLDAAREHPRPELGAVLRLLSRHRHADVRGRALAARAALDGLEAVAAIEAASDDVDPRIRQLAWALGQRHPSPAAEEIVARLLVRDEALAARVAEPTGLVPEQPSTPSAQARAPTAPSAATAAGGPA